VLSYGAAEDTYDCAERCEGDPDPTCTAQCYCLQTCTMTATDASLIPGCIAKCVGDLTVPSATIADLGSQMAEDQQCMQSNGEIYCLSKHSRIQKEKYIYLGVGIVGGIAVGALLGYMME